ncbi:pilZ domain-containing protein [Ditylenchus destructor]|nr:pilZ domain-containing protein [Ditylenchus destructor]
MDDRKKALLWSVYREDPQFRTVLPMLSGGGQDLGRALRQYPRYSIRCPGHLDIRAANDSQLGHFDLDVIEVSAHGFQAECDHELPLQIDGTVEIELGPNERPHVTARAVRRKDTEQGSFYGFRIDDPIDTGAALSPRWRWARPPRTSPHDFSLFLAGRSARSPPSSPSRISPRPQAVAACWRSARPACWAA